MKKEKSKPELHKVNVLKGTEPSAMSHRDGRGGRREGAGRPLGEEESRVYTFRASGKMAKCIDAQENKTDFIKDCIRDFLEKEGDGAVRSGAPEVRKVTGKSVISERTALERTELSVHMKNLGEVYPADRVKELRLPFFDIGLVAGFPIPLDNDEKSQDIELLKMLCPHPEASYLIRVDGNSMIDAGIFSGDIVIVDKSNRNPSESQVAVCEFNGEYTLKRFMKKDGFGWLVPANPDYPEIRICPEDEFSIWGTVTYIIHKPRD